MKEAYYKNRVPRSVWRNPWHFIAFGFGSGAVPVAPGTFGTLVAIPFYLLLNQLHLIYYLIAVLIIAIFAIILSDKVSREIKVHDHPGMNIDEFVGFFVTMINAPSGWQWIVIGFVLFRFFDIIKPPPIGWIDRHVQGGFGMILDDVLAGLISCVLMQLLAYIWVTFFIK
ncbi:MAG: phosphatidylglycerophosphatase A [Pseudomonadota bacterium]